MTSIRGTLSRLQSGPTDHVNAAALGLATDGSADVSGELQGFVDSLPDVRANSAGQFPGEPDISFNTSNTTTVFLPATDSDGAPLRYRFDNPVTVNGNKAVRFTSSGPHGAVLENNSAADHIFLMDGSPAAVGGAGANGAVSMFDNLVFWKGGIRYEGRFRGAIETHHNLFYQTPGPALFYGDGSDAFAPIHMSNYFNHYVQCAGSEWVTGLQAGIIGRSFNNRHLFNRDTAIVVDGTFYQVSSSDFQGMDKTVAPSTAFVLIRDLDEQSALVTLRDNRFAPESSDSFADGRDYGAPYAAVQCGLTPSETDVVSGIKFFNNQFLGGDVTDTTPGLGQYGIAFMHRPVDCLIDQNNYFLNLDVAAVGEQWTNGGTLTTGGQNRNHYGVSQVASSVVSFFEFDGFSWASTTAPDTATGTFTDTDLADLGSGSPNQVVVTHSLAIAAGVPDISFYNDTTNEQMVPSWVRNTAGDPDNESLVTFDPLTGFNAGDVISWRARS